MCSVNGFIKWTIIVMKNSFSEFWCIQKCNPACMIIIFGKLLGIQLNQCDNFGAKIAMSLKWYTLTNCASTKNKLL